MQIFTYSGIKIRLLVDKISDFVFVRVCLARIHRKQYFNENSVRWKCKSWNHENIENGVR
jgi:hypothetical protein